MMTDSELRDAALAKFSEELDHLKRTTRGLKGFNPPASSEWGKALAARGEGLSLLAQIGLQPPPDPPASSAIYLADFETGDFSQVVSQQESSAGRISLVPGVPWGGKWTAKTLIGPADKGVAGSSTGYRTEILVANIAAKFGVGSLQGQETWITWDQFVDPAFELSDDPNSWLLFAQFWTPGLETGSPCLAVNVAQGQMYLTRRGGTPAASNTRLTPIGLVPLGTVMRWKIHHRWNTSAGGLVEIWRDGTKLVSGDTLPNLAVGYESAVELKLGTYRSGVDPPTRDSYTLIDNVAFWRSDPGL